MRHYSLAALLLLVLIFVACEDDEDPPLAADVDLTFQFDAAFAGEPLAIQSATYAYPGGGELKVQRFQYYVSDLALLPEDGSQPVPLSEIELIDYASATEDNREGRTYTVPAGRYRGVRFGLGVKPELNNQPPSNFAATDPLNENEFWSERARYVFAKIEAKADLNADGLFDTSVSLHMGSNELYQEVTVDRDFTLTDATETLTITTDVLDALGGTDDPYDLGVDSNRVVHGGNQATAAGMFSRLATHFTLSR